MFVFPLVTIACYSASVSLLLFSLASVQSSLSSRPERPECATNDFKVNAMAAVDSVVKVNNGMVTLGAKILRIPENPYGKRHCYYREFPESGGF